MTDKRAVLAKIDETTCIGCTKCISACPVDAIIGASKQSHTVISDHCIGCRLCLPPCPVSCIELVPISDHAHEKQRARAQLGKALAQKRRERIERTHALKEQKDKAIMAYDIKNIIASSVIRSQQKKEIS